MHTCLLLFVEELALFHLGVAFSSHQEAVLYQGRVTQLIDQVLRVLGSRKSGPMLVSLALLHPVNVQASETMIIGCQNPNPRQRVPIRQHSPHFLWKRFGQSRPGLIIIFINQRNTVWTLSIKFLEFFFSRFHQLGCLVPTSRTCQKVRIRAILTFKM